MNPRTAMDCIACAVMPTAVWLIPVAVQNRITCSCAVSFVGAFAMAYSLHRPARYAAGGGGGGFGGLGGGGFGGFGGSMGSGLRSYFGSCTLLGHATTPEINSSSFLSSSAAACISGGLLPMTIREDG